LGLINAFGSILNGFTLNFVQMVRQVTLEEIRRRYKEQRKGTR